MLEKHIAIEIEKVGQRMRRIESSKLQEYGMKSEKNWETVSRKSQRERNYNTKLEATKLESTYGEEKNRAKSSNS